MFTLKIGAFRLRIFFYVPEKINTFGEIFNTIIAKQKKTFINMRKKEKNIIKIFPQKII